MRDAKSKENLMNRLRRIEGQVRGVQNMVDEERDCMEIMQQLAAVRSAVHSATTAFIQDYASTCLLQADEGDPDSRRELVENLVALVSKVP